MAISITQQPQSTSTTDWGASSFSISATGASPISYQWYFNSSSILNATSSTLSLPYVVASINDGYYYVIAYSASLGATSSQALLQINPLIIHQPQSITGPEGSLAVFSASFSSSLPLTYQWQLNGSNIAGATSTNYSTQTSPFFLYQGSYDIIGTTASGSTTSNNATLNIIPIGAIVDSPMSWCPYIPDGFGGFGQGYR